MLSQDIDNAASSIEPLIRIRAYPDLSGERALRGLQSNLRSMAEQARQLEAQMAPGSPVIDTVRSIAAGQRTARA